MVQKDDNIHGTGSTYSGTRLPTWLSGAVILLLLMVMLSACAEEPTEPVAEESPAPGIEEPTEPVAGESPAPGVEASPSPLAEASPSPAVEASPSPMAEASPSPLAEASPAPAGGATLDEITDEPEAFIGQTVTVNGAVNVVLNERMFSIADNTLLDLNEVLVIRAQEEGSQAASPSPAAGASPSPAAEASPSPMAAASPSPAAGASPAPGSEASPGPAGNTTTALETGQTVTVTGTLRQFVVAEIERDLGLDLNPEVETEFEEGRPVIIAESVEVGTAEADVTLENITADPAAFAGQTVMVNGGIDEVVTERAFTIADSTLLDTNEVLVVNAAQQALEVALRTGSPVRVTGTVRIFNLLEVEEELGRNLEDEAFEEFAGQPVILAESIQVVEATNVTLAEILFNTERYRGRLVTVEGSIERVLSERVFTITPSRFVEVNEVPVLTANEQILGDIGAELTADQFVQLTGVIRMLNVTKIEEDLGVELGPEVVSEFEGKPVIIATRVLVGAREAK